MHAYQIWKDLGPELNHEILDSACTENKKLYKQLLEEVSKALRVRPQKLLEASRKERHDRFHDLLGRPDFGILSQNLLMNWLDKSQRAMLVAFLDKLNLKHDGKGYVDEFPPTMDDVLLKKAVEHLYNTFEKEKVSTYLKTFDSIAACNWPLVEQLVH